MRGGREGGGGGGGMSNEGRTGATGSVKETDVMERERGSESTDRQEGKSTVSQRNEAIKIKKSENRSF